MSRRKRGDKRPKQPVAKLRNNHAMLEESFVSFRKCFRKGILIIEPNGKVILCKPFIRMVIGDTTESNELCYQYMVWVHHGYGNTYLGFLGCRYSSAPPTTFQGRPRLSQDWANRKGWMWWAKVDSGPSIPSPCHETIGMGSTWMGQYIFGIIRLSLSMDTTHTLPLKSMVDQMTRVVPSTLIMIVSFLTSLKLQLPQLEPSPSFCRTGGILLNTLCTLQAPVDVQSTSSKTFDVSYIPRILDLHKCGKNCAAKEIPRRH